MNPARFVVSALVALTLLAGCEAAVSSDLGTVSCQQPNVVGPPACPAGSICSKGQCAACAGAELCGDGVDNDCDGLIDNGCSTHVVGAGGHGVGGAAGAGIGGSSIAGSSASGGVIGAAGMGGDGAGDTGGSGERAGSGGDPNAAGNGGAPNGGMPNGGTPDGGGGNGNTGGSAGGSGPTTLGYGDSCEAGDVCPSDAFCLDWADLGETMSGSICTKPCCSSSQCGDSTTAACIPSPNGASMCMAGAPFGRGQIGTLAIGAACGTGDTSMYCRSGFCEDGFCNDVCCKDSNCAGTSKPACIKNYLADESPIRYGYQCGVAKGTKMYATLGDDCTQDSQCESYACDLDAGIIAGTYCAKDCCVSSDCGSVNLFGFDTYQIACVYSSSTHGYVRSCAAASDSWGSGTLGDDCSVDTDCATDKCIADSTGALFCSDTCCKDDDCGGGMFHCAPYLASGDTVSVFRCVR